MTLHPMLITTIARQRSQELLGTAADDRRLAEATASHPRSVRSTVFETLRADLFATAGAVVLAGSVLMRQFL